MPSHVEMWKKLDDSVDVLIIGGGINGAGIARDAARRGLSVAVCEMRDLAWGTSSRSSKLVHGGLRYLEQFEFSLVFESVSERRILLEIAPHLVNPLGFVFPIYKGAKHGLAKMGAGMWLYEGLSLFRSPKRHKTVRAKDLASVEPALKSEGFKGAPLYYDCSTDDARLTLESALDAADHGAVIATRCKVESFSKDEHGRIVGAVVRDMLGGETKTVTCKVAVNATGPWTERTIELSQKVDNDLLAPTKGVHIVVDHQRIPINNAVVLTHPGDGRTLFAIPWGEQTYIGTTDTYFEGDPAKVAATSEDVDYLIAASNAYFPKNAITREHVISTWAGLRPLMRPVAAGGAVSESQVSREHQIVVGDEGLITIAGGKLTTYRRMSAEVVDTVVNMMMLLGESPELADPKTQSSPLPGAVGWPADDDHEKVAVLVMDASDGSLTIEQSRHLANTYGMRAIEIAARVSADPALAAPLIEGRQEIVAQVDWAVDKELAATVEDVMMRRTQLFYRDADQGLGASDIVATHMAARIGWSEDQKRASIEAYAATVAESRAWRS